MKKLLFSLFAIMAFVACTDSGSDDGGGNSNNEKPKVPEITLDATAVNFTTDGGSTVVTFTSSDAWTAEAINNRADAWCNVSPTSGSAGASKITVTTTANDTADDRTATVVIKSGTIQKTIAVSQKQKDALTVTSSKFEVSADGGEIEIEVKANIDFNVEIDESAKSWATHRSTRAMKTSTLLFEVDENSDSEKRKANITITSGKLRETITIYQESNKPSIVITQNEYTVPSAGETIAVEVKSNVDVTVEMPADASWITENTTRATSTNTYYFDIETNNEYDSRTAKIKFVNNENNLTETVAITQTQKDAIVIAEDSYAVKGEGGEINIEVGHNIEFDIKIDGSWITLKQTRALETSKLTFVVAENTTDKAREGSIIFASKDGTISQKISVTQGAPTYEISYTTSNGKILPIEFQWYHFRAYVVSHEHVDGKGVITFDRPIEYIAADTFADCTTLTSITIPKSVTDCDGSIYGCVNLESIYGPYASEDNRSLIINGELSIFAPKGVTEYTIPEGVTSVGVGVFYKCYNLKKINIPNSVIEIKDSAFRECTALQSLIIPESVTTIPFAAIKGCVSLSNFDIPDGVTKIESYAFWDCKSLTSINIPANIVSIGYAAFYNCSSLTSVNCKPINPPTLDDFAFYYNAFGRKIYVPEDSVNTYKTTNGWKDYADDIVSDKKFPVNSVSLDRTSVEMAEGDEITLTVTINPDNASNKSVIWSSSNTSVAIVDNGKVTALTPGQTTITVKTVDGEKTATCVITVIAKVYNVESISLNKSKLSMMTGDEEILEATITPENAADKTIIWSSDNPMIASVDNGKVKAHKLGTATITATTQDGCKTASCIISVVDIDSMIDVSFSGMDVLSGSLSYEGSFIKLTPGVNLKVSITNYSNHSITLTGFKLICGMLQIQRNYTLEEMEIPGKKVLELTVPISTMAIYSPIAEITYRYDSKTYTASVQFDGTFRSKQSHFKGDLISLTPYPLL